jgi:hypothetical protein
MSAEAAILLRPAEAYRRLAHDGSIRPRANAIKRLLFSALLLGCTISLIVSGRLTLRLVVGGALAWSFVPLVQTASFAAVHRAFRAATTFSRDLDLFFAGSAPWSIWLIGLGALATVSSPLQIVGWTATTSSLAVVAASVTPVVLWSGYIDFCFYREVWRRDHRDAIRVLVAYRAFCWTAGLLYFFGFAGWPLLVSAIRG